MSSTDALSPVGFIGLGAMGFAMSTHLVRTGFPVRGYDIYRPTLERWETACKDIKDSRAVVADSPADAVKDASVVCLMVANHHHVHSALFDDKLGAVHALAQHCTVIIHATIPPTQPGVVRSRLTEEFHRPDVKLIDAPVSGGVARSVNGTLTIMASSDEAANLEQPSAKQVLENLASKGETLYPIPGGLGTGESAKALNQVMCGIHMVAASEIMGLAAINGLDTEKFYDSLVSRDSTGQTALGWSWMFENRGPRMLSATPATASATAIIDKDVGIIRDEETRLNVDLPLLNRTSEILKQVMKTHAAADDSVVVQYYLGFASPRQNLVVEQAGRANESTPGQEIDMQMLAHAHAIIHLNSAYETIKFAQALDLMSPDQQKQWFAIISSAAGASTIFSEVIPRALGHPDGIDVAFSAYADEKFRDIVGEAVCLSLVFSFGAFVASDTTSLTTGFLAWAQDAIISDAKEKGYQPLLLEAALNFVRQLLSDDE